MYPGQLDASNSFHPKAGQGGKMRRRKRKEEKNKGPRSDQYKVQSKV
jgi:hypothetical protein